MQLVSNIMRAISFILFLFLFASSLFPQDKYDKIFINENTVLIGSIISENDLKIRFFDLESNDTLLIYKANLFKIIYKNGKVNVLTTKSEELLYENSNTDNKKNDESFGILICDYNISDPDYEASNFIDEAAESFHFDRTLKVIRFLYHNPEYYWIEYDVKDLTAKTMIIRLPPGDYSIEFLDLFKGSKYEVLPSILNTKNESAPIKTNIKIENYKVTRINVTATISEGDSWFYHTYNYKLTFTIEKPEVLSINSRLHKDLSLFDSYYGFFHNSIWGGLIYSQGKEIEIPNYLSY